jgi:hypothetical protein
MSRSYRSSLLLRVGSFHNVARRLDETGILCILSNLEDSSMPLLKVENPLFFSGMRPSSRRRSIFSSSQTGEIEGLCLLAQPSESEPPQGSARASVPPGPQVLARNNLEARNRQGKLPIRELLSNSNAARNRFLPNQRPGKICLTLHMAVARPCSSFQPSSGWFLLLISPSLKYTFYSLVVHSVVSCHPMGTGLVDAWEPWPA